MQWIFCKTWNNPSQRDGSFKKAFEQYLNVLRFALADTVKLILKFAFGLLFLIKNFFFHFKSTSQLFKTLCQINKVKVNPIWYCTENMKTRRECFLNGILLANVLTSKSHFDTRFFSRVCNIIMGFDKYHRN